jgi:flavodoxin
LIDFSQYDLIFVGSPTWGLKFPDVVSIFLDRTDFQGKTVIAFATAASNLGNIFQDFQNHAHNGNVIETQGFLHVAKTSDETLDQLVSEMLNNL